MIYTVTLNPALDYVVKVPDFKPGDVNRTEEERIYLGGKGINVSIILSRLGMDTTALGFTAGFTGDEIERVLGTLGCKAAFTRVKSGVSRICVKVLAGEETEINGRGPSVSAEELDALFISLSKAGKGDTVVLAGSIPASLPRDVYNRMLELLAGKGVYTVVDTAGEALLNTLQYKPFLIKPNLRELSELFHEIPCSGGEMTTCAKKLIQAGAQNVLVSLGGDGALLVTQSEGAYRCPAPKGKAVYTVGAGDSMVAGFVKGYSEHGSYREALALAVAAGSATAYSPWLAEREEIVRLREQVTVERL